MARPVETNLTISCLQCEWSIETLNTSAALLAALLEEAQKPTLIGTSNVRKRSSNG